MKFLLSLQMQIIIMNIWRKSTTISMTASTNDNIRRVNYLTI